MELPESYEAAAATIRADQNGATNGAADNTRIDEGYGTASML